VVKMVFNPASFNDFRARRGCLVVGFTTTYPISTYHY
jgi:hypothetical protein